MGHFHSNCAFPSHQLEVLEVPCSGTQTFWPFQVVRHILWRKTAMRILTLTSLVPSFVIFVHLRLRLWRRENVQGAVSDLSKFLFLFLFFSLTKIYYPFFPPSILMSLRVLHVLHNSTSPSQSCSCDSAGNKSKQGFNSFFFIFSSQPSTPQVLHAWLPLPHAHCSRTFPPSLLWHNCRWASFLLPQQLLFQGVRQRFGMCVSAVVLLL